MAAISSGSPMRPCAFRLARRPNHSRGRFWSWGVSVAPGATALMQIPSWPYSTAAWRVNADDAALRRRIAERVADADQCCCGRDVDDPASAVLDHRREDGSHSVPSASKVRAHHSIPGVVIDVDGRVCSTGAVPGNVGQRVDRAELGTDTADHSDPFGQRGPDVEDQSERCPASIDDPCDRLVREA